MGPKGHITSSTGAERSRVKGHICYVVSLVNLLFVSAETRGIEIEVEEVLSNPGEDRPGREGSRVADLCVGPSGGKDV